uniref:Transcription factor 24 n=2 Tax=Latimeria chalumnae TaxID=7897 RepID=H3A508_LATCH
MVESEKSPMEKRTVPVSVMDESPTCSPSSSRSLSPSSDPDSLLPSAPSHVEPALRSKALRGTGPASGRGRPAAANAARERSRVQTLRHAFLELQRTLPSVPPDTKLSKLDVLILATTYIAHLTRTLQEEGMEEGDSSKQTEILHTLKGDGYLHPVKKWPMRSRLYVGATGQFLSNSVQGESSSQGGT